MIIDYSLENNGEKRIETKEYCHNFISINNAKIGPEYNLNQIRKTSLKYI